MAQPRLPRICSIDNCGRKHAGKGLCEHHYNKLYNHGDPLKQFPKPKCSIEGCERKHYGKGWCRTHWKRWYRHGDPHAILRAEDGAALKFIYEVAVPFAGDECLIWPYAKDGKSGYGFIRIDGRSQVVSRVVCQIVHGDPPLPKMDAAHSCGNGHLACCNQKHLRWATRLENVADARAHGTMIVGEKHPHSKLTEEDVRALRALKGKATLSELSSRFGVCGSHISEIQNMKVWKHLK